MGVSRVRECTVTKVLRYFRLEWQVTDDRKEPAIEGCVYKRGMRTPSGCTCRSSA
jgi:hypothetical protein